mmetsp:Transcript_38977/g.61699  ORF Transcript_38977/g.61699 Transcript_38977/m.61699 type:complete len:481 (+) Transcript_38977:72-1514(+)
MYALSAVVLCVALSLSLHGCGGGGKPPSPPPAPTTTAPATTSTTAASPSPSPTPTTTDTSTTGTTSSTAPSPTPSPSGDWKLEPIALQGSHLYGSRSGKQFFAKGFAFPNVQSSSVDAWIEMLEKIHELGPNINAVRIYELPSCAGLMAADQPGFCSFKPFMQKADSFGIYVLLPASGTVWGWFPGLPAACKPPLTNSAGDDLNGCYDASAGGILGFGRQMVNNFNFPNVLAFVLANEVEQNFQAFPVVKAYARDMKEHMKLCNTNKESPTFGKMRQIPLAYAATDIGNADIMQLTDYLLCDSKDVSLDMMGINIERWTNDPGGHAQYKALSDAVGKKKWPAAWMHTEEGGPDHDHKSRTWHQLKDFFANYSHVDGYYAYAWNSANHDFDMFDSTDVNASMYPDGKAFFDAISKSGADPATTKPAETTTPDCASNLPFAGKTYVMVDYKTIKIYDTGANGWAPNCPVPWQDKLLDASIAV